MNTFQLISLRIFSVTLGRIGAFALLLKKILIHVLITRSQDKYVAASRYFDCKELRKNIHQW